MGQRRAISSDMSETFCDVLPLNVALFVSMIHIIYTSILYGYLLAYFIIYAVPCRNSKIINHNNYKEIKIKGWLSSSINA